MIKMNIFIHETKVNSNFYLGRTNRLLFRGDSESSDKSSGMTQRSVISVAERARLGWLRER